MTDAQTPTTESMDTTETTVNAAAGDEDDRKLFVGGLPQDAKEDEIKEYFSTFGEIESVNLKTDAATGRSRGFAFVMFKAAEGVEKTTAQAEHTLKNKKVAVKKAQAKPGKIYVGKLKAELTDEEIKEFFAGYGTITNVEQPFDKQKNERKTFCFITFDKEETAKTLLKEGTVTIKGHELEIKKVTPKGNDARGGGYGGRGGGRGGGQQWGGYGGGQQWGGYGDQYGGWGGYGYGGPDPYYGGGGWGYGGGWGGYGGQPQAGGYGAGGKTPRGRDLSCTGNNCPGPGAFRGG